MEKFIKGFTIFFFTVFVALGLAALFAYPTKWVVNYLFSEQFLSFVFGVAHLDFWRALALNFISGTLFKSSSSTKS